MAADLLAIHDAPVADPAGRGGPIGSVRPSANRRRAVARSAASLDTRPAIDGLGGREERRLRESAGLPVDRLGDPDAMSPAPRDTVPDPLTLDDPRLPVAGRVGLHGGAIEERVDALRLGHGVGPGLAEHRLGQLGEERLDAARVRPVAEVFVVHEPGRAWAATETDHDRGGRESQEQGDGEPAETVSVRHQRRPSRCHGRRRSTRPAGPVSAVRPRCRRPRRGAA